MTTTKKNYEYYNAASILETVNAYLENMEEEKSIYGKAHSLYISDVCDELSIFDWWNDWLSKSQLEDMRKFLREALKLGFTGHVCFKVGATGCANGMWAYTETTTDGYSPRNCRTLFKSFTPAYNYWDVSDDNGEFNTDPETYDSIKTIKQLEAKFEQMHSSPAAEDSTEEDSTVNTTPAPVAADALSEIPQENECITLKAAQDYLESLAKKLCLNVEHYNIVREFNTEISDKFVRVDLAVKNASYKDDKLIYNLEANCSIRRMGSLSVDEMFEASDQIGAAAKIAEVFNKRMKYVKVMF